MDGNLHLNYSNIFLTHHRMEDSICDFKLKEHSLVFVCSGKIVVRKEDHIVHINEGECAFISRDIRLDLTKYSSPASHLYQTIVLKFSRQFLLDIYRKIEKDKLPQKVSGSRTCVMKLPSRPEITGLFNSIKPFFDTNLQPDEEWLRMKMTEGLYIVLKASKQVYASLFDFTDPWKIDLLGFLNENYMYDLSLEDLAIYTGRSLSSLKLDFKKISNLPPRKWIIRKRLEVTHDLITNKKGKVKDIIAEVGFKNLSHFSRLYKETYGHAPTMKP